MEQRSRDPELPIGAEFMRGIDLWTVWNAVHCPVLVLRGADSEVLRAGRSAEMRKRKPDAQSGEFAGVGHAPALFDAAQIEAVRRFLLVSAESRRRAAK